MVYCQAACLPADCLGDIMLLSSSAAWLNASGASVPKSPISPTVTYFAHVLVIWRFSLLPSSIFLAAG
jgi:hypothetical protein